MTREEMLQKLGTLKYRVIFPGPGWNDLGFTEREIWINDKGYGYFACDDPSSVCYKVKGIANEKWKNIRTKIREGTLSIEDIHGSSLGKLPFFEDEESFEVSRLNNILSLPETMGPYYYCGETWEEIVFFDSADDCAEFFERDWYDIAWNDLPTNVLECWIQRLFEGEFDLELGEKFIFELVE